MKHEIEIPDTVDESLREQFGDVSRKALEALAVEGYKSGALSAYQVRTMLGFSIGYETDGFLKKHEAWLPLTAEEVQREVNAISIILELA